MQFWGWIFEQGAEFLGLNLKEDVDFGVDFEQDPDIWCDILRKSHILNFRASKVL